jgi:alkylation response protein AidB-like acyl-CoA dehydrogenase
LEFFDESRILVAAQALCTAQGAFDRALDYLNKENIRQKDRPISGYPA